MRTGLVALASALFTSAGYSQQCSDSAMVNRPPFITLRQFSAGTLDTLKFDSAGIRVTYSARSSNATAVAVYVKSPDDRINPEVRAEPPLNADVLNCAGYNGKSFEGAFVVRIPPGKYSWGVAVDDKKYGRIRVERNVLILP